MKFALSSVILSLSATAYAANQIVQVAPQGSFTYSPSSVTAAVGDTIEFQFASNNHSVAQASFNTPCQPLAGGIWSGFVITTGSQNNAQTTSQGQIAGYKRQNSMPSFTVTVNDTNPAFFYCAQISHCQLGMVFAINPSSNMTLNAFQSAAMNANTVVPNVTPGQGGILSTSGTGGSASPSPTSDASSNFASLIVLLFSGLVAAAFLS